MYTLKNCVNNFHNKINKHHAIRKKKKEHQYTNYCSFFTGKHLSSIKSSQNVTKNSEVRSNKN